MASAGYGPVNGGKIGRDDEDGLVDEWGVRYEGHHKPGGGTFKRQRRSRRKYLYLAGAAIVVFLIIVIIAVAVQKHSSPPSPHPSDQPVYGKWQNNTKKGVTFYPVPSDGNVLIKYDFRASDARGYLPLIESLDRTLHDYKMINQQGDEFFDCTNTSAPADKVCRFDTGVFSSCDKGHQYGYSSGRPCVLLQLNLPRNMTVTTFDNTSKVAKDLGDNYRADHIGVTCAGLTAKDQQNMNVHDKAIKEVQYFPPLGFPAYWFRPRSIDQFLPPVVMVKFNTLRDAINIQVKCTAWAKSFNNGRPENSTLFSTNFTIYHI